MSAIRRTYKTSGSVQNVDRIEVSEIVPRIHIVEGPTFRSSASTRISESSSAISKDASRQQIPSTSKNEVIRKSISLRELATSGIAGPSGSSQCQVQFHGIEKKLVGLPNDSHEVQSGRTAAPLVWNLSMPNTMPNTSNSLSIAQVNVLPNKLKLYNLPSGHKAIRVRAPDASTNACVEIPTLKTRTNESIDVGMPNSFSMQKPPKTSTPFPSQSRKSVNVKMLNVSTDRTLEAPFFSQDQQKCGDRPISELNSKQIKDRDFYLQKWLDCFQNRNDQDEDANERLAQERCDKEVQMRSEGVQLTSELPEEETASLLWQLSIGKPLSLEEVDKIIMFLVNLKFKAISNFGNQRKKKSKSRTSDYRVPDLPVFPMPETYDQPPSPEVSDPEPCSSEIPEPQPANNAPPPTVRRSRRQMLKRSASKTITRKWASKRSRIEDYDQTPLTEDGVRTQNSSLRCQQCGIQYVRKKIFLEHVDLCRGILVSSKPLLHAPNNESTSPTEEEEDTEKRPCLACYKKFAGDRALATHMVIKHAFYWCYEFQTEEEYEDWFKREDILATMINRQSTPSIKRGACDTDWRRFYVCLLNGRQKTLNDCTKCPCWLDVHKYGDKVHVTMKGFHNHTEVHRREIKQDKGILVKVARSSEEEKEGSYERKCLECSEAFSCDKDYQLHMAQAHNYYWGYEFANEREFRAWFREEGLHMVMYIGKQMNFSDHIQGWYYCRGKSETGEKCTCRLRYTIKADKVSVKYNVLHNHTEIKAHNTSRINFVDIKWPRPAQDQPSIPIERNCVECKESFINDKDYEVHMSEAHDYSWHLEFPTEEDWQTWFRQEGIHETKYLTNKTTIPGGYRYIFKCYFHMKREKYMTEKTCFWRMMVAIRQNGVKVQYFPKHICDSKGKKEWDGFGNTEKWPRAFKGIMVEWPRHSAPGSSIPPEEEKRERVCPECEKVLMCDKDFELHMAVAHKYAWCYKFGSEEEFQTWFREHQLDETMVAVKNNTISSGSTYKYFTCLVYRDCYRKNRNIERCYCRLNFKANNFGIHVRYYPLHSHSERIVRRQFTNDCRKLVFQLMKDGLRNLEILKAVKDTYPPTSLNYLIRDSDLRAMRQRFRRYEKRRDESKSLPKSFAEVCNVPPQVSRESSDGETVPAVSGDVKEEGTSRSFDAKDRFDEDEIEMLPSPKGEPQTSDNDTDASEDSLNYL